MRRSFGRFVTLMAAAVVLAGLAATTAGAADTGTIKGKVKYDGVGLADVQVFLLDPASGPRLTCTNGDGFYKFKNVTAGSGIVMATGPGD